MPFNYIVIVIVIFTVMF